MSNARAWEYDRLLQHCNEVKEQLFEERERGAALMNRVQILRKRNQELRNVRDILRDLLADVTSTRPSLLLQPQPGQSLPTPTKG